MRVAAISVTRGAEVAPSACGEHVFSAVGKLRVLRMEKAFF